MGCDIHTFIEYYGKRWDQARSEHVECWVFNKAQAFPYAYAGLGEGRWSNDYPPYTNQPYQGRDYDLFAMLADVRNDGNIQGIQPKGLPDNASKRAIKELEDDVDIHSVSYFTLQELQDLLDQGHFKQETWENGVLTAKQYIALKRDGVEPQGWSRWIAGGDVTVGTPEQVDRLIPPAPPKATPEELAAIPPMPGEARPVDVPAPAPQPGASFNELYGMKDTEKLGGFNHVQAQWNRTIDREDVIRRIIEHGRKFATPIGERPKWGEPDTRERDLTSVRMLFGFDN